MPEEAVVVVPAADAAPVVATTPDPVVTATTGDAPAPQSAEGESKPDEKPAKTFTQEELDAQIGKRLDKERRKWEREQRAKAPLPAPAAAPQADDNAPQKPQIGNFQTVEDYDAAMTKYAEDKAAYLKAKEASQAEARRQQDAQQEVIEAHMEREEGAREKYSDYDLVVGNPRLPITSHMADAIRESDNGPDIAYHLGKNPKEAARIASLRPIAQAKEIGKLEAKLIAEPPGKKQSSAPDPISPIKPSGTLSFTDLDDPRSLKALGTSGWIAARQARDRELARKGR